MLAPVALFVYNRPKHTRQTVEALQKNELAGESELFIFADGLKKPEHADAVCEVRQYVRTVEGFKSVTIVERDENYGLARSIITGVTEIVNRFDRIIVLEDDLVTSPYFLRYMNEALELYKNDKEVISIHGYIYPVRAKLPETFFLRGADCWGWATWRRGWNLFEPAGQLLLNELKNRKLTKQFDFDGAYPYTKMLTQQVTGGNNSWAIRWYAAAFLKDKLTLYPGKSLVFNTGIDASGTHCMVTTDIFDTEISRNPLKVEKIPLEENVVARQAVRNFFRSSQLSLVRTFNNWFNRIVGRLT